MKLAAKQGFFPLSFVWGGRRGLVFWCFLFVVLGLFLVALLISLRSHQYLGEKSQITEGERAAY